MQIERFNIEDLLLILPAQRQDHRGFFSETYRNDVLTTAGLRAEFIQDNHAYSAERGVLRGLHFQIPPRAQGKMVRCTAVSRDSCLKQGAHDDTAVNKGRFGTKAPFTSLTV
jgi:dTDP-4-dehydrorhamnose 3,5-epimerase-like enzyme